MKFLFSILLFFFGYHILEAKRLQTVYLPMDDGVRLHTEIVFPKKKNTTMSTILVRSPYGYFDLEKYEDLYSRFGFVCVGQDWRGTGKSEGHFSLFQTEGKDGKTTYDWIRQQEWSNGKIFTFGASADGMASMLLAKENVSLAGQFILVSTGISYENFYPGGVYRYGLIEKWLRDTLHPEDLNTTLDTIQKHTTYDEWWKQIDIRDSYSFIRYPTTFYAGWYDIFTMGNIVTFEGYQKQSSLPHQHYLIIDPCGHCQEAASYFPDNLIEGRTGIEIMLNLYQFGVIQQLHRNIKSITFYVMTHNDTKEGDIGNFFVSMEDWPKYKETRFFLQGSDLVVEKPTKSSFQSFIHNPNNPSPTIGGNNYELPCGPLDQSSLLERSDVLVFTSKPMTKPFIITGPMFLFCSVKSNSSSFHITVRLTDYYKNESRLIMDGIQLMNSSHGVVNLWNTSYVFNPGHQIQILVSGSNYPRFNVSMEYSSIEINSASHLFLPEVNFLLPEVNLL